MTLTEDQQKSWLKKLGDELNKRAANAALLDSYYDGEHPYPEAVKSLRVVNAYNRVMDMSRANWPKLVVDSVEERLHVQGVRFGSKVVDTAAWQSWQENSLDLASSLVHTQALTGGRAYAIVWPKPGGGVTITPEHASTTVVKYRDGTLLDREVAMRRWYDGNRWYANLYTDDAIYKYVTKDSSASGAQPGQMMSWDEWELREVPDETNPVTHRFGKVPVVEFAANPRLRPTPFGQLATKGEFQDMVGHIDRINYTTFSWIVAMTSLGFDLHVLIGDKILYDDDGNPIAPFDRSADRVIQIENPDAKLVNVSGTDLTNFEKTAEAFIRHLATITKTPAHYLLGEMINLSADAIRAAEAGLIGKVGKHQVSFGESWEEVWRLALQMDGRDEVADLKDAAQDPSAETIWADAESRSLAERADAAAKMKDLLPWQALAEQVLGLTPKQISRYEAMRSSESLTGAMAAALLPQPAAAQTPPAAPSGNGGPPQAAVAAE